MFDSNAIFEIPKYHITLRYPSDDELIERQRIRELIVRTYSDGGEEVTVQPTRAFDGRLLQSLQESGPALDEYESCDALSILDKCEIIDMSEQDGGYRVELGVSGGKTIHIVRTPTQRELADYKDDIHQQISYPYKRKTIVRIGAARTLYDAIVITSEGYTGRIPVTHKAAVCYSVIAFIGLKTGEARPVDPTIAKSPIDPVSVN
jgi:hypothetical protein